MWLRGFGENFRVFGSSFKAEVKVFGLRVDGVEESREGFLRELTWSLTFFKGF